MPLVSITVNERGYTVACDEGEQDHLRELGAHVDSKVRELVDSVGHAGEARLLLMAALLIADEHFETRAELEKRTKEIEELAGSRERLDSEAAARERDAAAALDRAAKRVEDIAARLGRA